jgi:hypothetical protein
MSEGSDLRVGQTSEERDDIVHEILVINYGVLTLFHEDLHKVTEVVAELLPGLARHDEWVLTTFLEYKNVYRPQSVQAELTKCAFFQSTGWPYPMVMPIFMWVATLDFKGTKSMP